MSFGRGPRGVRAAGLCNGRRAARLGVHLLVLLAALVAACGTSSSPAEQEARPPTPPEPYARPEYRMLSETGVYEDLAAKSLSRAFEAFAPSYVLFADGADKRRFVALPPGTVVDTSDLNHWTFPVGTRFVKEFWLDGALLETRLIERYGEGQNDYFMGAFVWSDDGTEAELAPEGETDVRATPHDVPGQKQCTACHNGEAGRVLGFSALELGRASDDPRELTLDELVRTRRVSDVPAGTLWPPPGDAVTARALGYLHANCGHCHNLHGTSWPDTQMVLRLDVEERVAEDSALYRSLVGQPVQYFRDESVDTRVKPGEPDASAVVVRMEARGDDRQMPPLGTEIPDNDGILALRDWILTLPP